MTHYNEIFLIGFVRKSCFTLEKHAKIRKLYFYRE